MRTYPKLFERGPDGQNNALLNFTPDRTYGFVEGYRLAADLLVAQVLATGQNQDLLVFPIIFSYRHHLELRFKEIINRGEGILGNTVMPFGHSLGKLWLQAKDVIQRLNISTGEPEEFDLLDHFISELTLIDGDSTSFRYAEDIKGDNRLAHIDCINLRHLKECMDACCDTFEGIAFAISVMEDDISDTRSSYL